MGRTLAALALVAGLSGCGQGFSLGLEGPGGEVPVVYLGQTYTVRAVAREPRPDLDPAGLTTLPDGGLAVPSEAPMTARGPALRVSGAVDRQTASDVAALYCKGRGLDIGPGWRGAPVRFDPVAAEHVIYFSC